MSLKLITIAPLEGSYSHSSFSDLFFVLVYQRFPFTAFVFIKLHFKDNRVYLNTCFCLLVMNLVYFLY